MNRKVFCGDCAPTPFAAPSPTNIANARAAARPFRIKMLMMSKPASFRCN
jgi:hypothetical protein